MAAQDQKDQAVDHIDRDNTSHSTYSEEKGVAPKEVYPLQDEDYVVTFKTWIVVTILASAYGVSFFEGTHLNQITHNVIRSLSGLSLPLPSHQAKSQLY
jgi:hypothetical protein